MATEAATEHVGEINANDVTKDVDEVSIAKPTDTEVKDETNKTEDSTIEAVEKPGIEETATLVDESKKDDVEDNHSDLKQSVENEKPEEKPVTEESKEEIDLPPVEKTESETIKEVTVSENVTAETEIVEQTPELPAEPDAIPAEEEKKAEPVTTSVAQEIVSDDTVTVTGSQSTDDAKDEKSTANAVETTNEGPSEVTDTEVAVVSTEVTDTEVAEGSVVTEVPDIITEAKHVSEDFVDPNTEKSEPAAGSELSGNATDIDNPQGIVEKDVIVEQTKQDYNPESEKLPTLLDEPVSEAPTTSSATEIIDIAPDEDTAAKEREVIPEPITEIQSLNDEAQVVSESPSNEAHETTEVEKFVAPDSAEVTDAKEVEESIITEVPEVVKTDEDVSASACSNEPAPSLSDLAPESEKLVVVDSSEVTDTKDVGERIISEVPDVLEKTGDETSASVELQESTVNVSSLDTAESFDQTSISESTAAKLEEVVEVEEATEENVVQTLVEAVETVVTEKIATATEEVKDSVSESSLVEKEGSGGENANLVEASREFDIAGALEKAVATEGEAKEVEIEKKQTEAKQTLLDKFINETSESKKEEEAAKAADEVVAETVAATYSANPKPDEQTPAKTSQRHSNNLMSKFKQSIVKVKKAITGKSTSSKTIQTDAKDDDAKAK